jgi:hypothetical protein
LIDQAELPLYERRLKMAKEKAKKTDVSRAASTLGKGRREERRTSTKRSIVRR